MDRAKAFVRAFQFLKSRIITFTHLPLANLDQFTIGTRLQAIGHLEEQVWFRRVGRTHITWKQRLKREALV